MKNKQHYSPPPAGHPRTILPLVTCLLLLLMGCDKTNGKQAEITALTDGGKGVSPETAQALTALKAKKILFAHHSVGANILAGLASLSADSGVDLVVTRADSGPVAAKANILSLSPGQNRDPGSKVNDYEEQIATFAKSYGPDIALLKFCFIDFPPEAEVAEILAQYRDKVAALKRQNPEILFAHITVPLTARKRDAKARLKRSLGRQDWSDGANIARAQFNDLLQETFPGEPIFDLARLESTYPDGTRSSYTFKGKTYYSLAPEYTNDGGHLNRLGQRLVASEFAIFLADTLQARPEQPL
ncbi:MAG: hypothetical protein ABFR97_10130 [Thermodesulfobacteriota bacterium]